MIIIKFNHILKKHLAVIIMYSYFSQEFLELVNFSLSIVHYSFTLRCTQADTQVTYCHVTCDRKHQRLGAWTAVHRSLRAVTRTRPVHA